MNASNPDILADDLLFRIQHRIARRADELARHPNSSSPANPWSQAECEVWETELADEPPSGNRT